MLNTKINLKIWSTSENLTQRKAYNTEVSKSGDPTSYALASPLLENRV